MMIGKCWWEDKDPGITVDRLRIVIGGAISLGDSYRADRGRVPSPDAEDADDLRDLTIALLDRVTNGRTWLEAHPDQTRYRRIVQLLEIDTAWTGLGYFDAISRSMTQLEAHFA